VNASKPLTMPRYVKPREMEVVPRCRDTAVVMRQVATGEEGPVV
jgi:hypothetical protein